MLSFFCMYLDVYMYLRIYITYINIPRYEEVKRHKKVTPPLQKVQIYNAVA